jgi:hypothetical protein
MSLGMSLTQVTRLLTRQEVSPPAGWKIPFFFIKNLHKVQIFYEKEKRVPCCRRRIGLFIQVNTWFGTDRVTHVTECHIAAGTHPAV